MVVQLGMIIAHFRRRSRSQTVRIDCIIQITWAWVWARFLASRPNALEERWNVMACWNVRTSELLVFCMLVCWVCSTLVLWYCVLMYFGIGHLETFWLASCSWTWVLGSSDKVLEIVNLQCISMSRDGSRKLYRVKKIEMGFRRPQKDDGSTSKYIEHF